MAKIPKTYDGFEAYGHLFSALVYLLKHPQYGIFLYAMGGGFGWNELSHYTGIKVVVEEKAKSTKVGPVSFFEPYSTRPFMLVQQKKSFRKKSLSQDAYSENAMVLDGEFYEAFKDILFDVFKEEGTSRVLIYYSPTKVGRWFTIDPEMFNLDKYSPTK